MLAPETLSELLAHRWILLTTFAAFVPYSERTLRRWCERGKLPASKRFGDFWWIDIRAFRAMRRDGSEDLLA